MQLMNLKAAAQKGGLDAASTGWAILERLGTEVDRGPEWNEVWHAISTGKVGTSWHRHVKANVNVMAE